MQPEVPDSPTSPTSTTRYVIADSVTLARRRRVPRRRVGHRRRLLRPAEVSLLSAGCESADAQRPRDGQGSVPRGSAPFVVSRPLAARRATGATTARTITPRRSRTSTRSARRSDSSRGRHRRTLGAPPPRSPAGSRQARGDGPRNERAGRVLAPEPQRRSRPRRRQDDGRSSSHLLAEYDIEIAGGLGDLAGEIFRIGCMGYSARPENRLVSRLVRSLTRSECKARTWTWRPDSRRRATRSDDRRRLSDFQVTRPKRKSGLLSER